MGVGNAVGCFSSALEEEAIMAATKMNGQDSLMESYFHAQILGFDYRPVRFVVGVAYWPSE